MSDATYESVVMLPAGCVCNLSRAGLEALRNADLALRVDGTIAKDRYGTTPRRDDALFEAYREQATVVE